MPAQRGPDGTTDGAADKPAHDRNEPTRRVERRGLGGAVPSRAMDAATADPRVVLQPPARDERTQLAGTRPAAADRQADSDNPVVGWLVVVEGPGRGQARALGYGMNGIGRRPDQRVSLDFGDSQISRVNHAAVVYDPRGRKFFLQHGSSANLTYLDGQLVLSPEPLDSGSDIVIGRTKLRFVALCGPEFDWQDG
jgi:hypothetical protein